MIIHIDVDMLAFVVADGRPPDRRRRRGGHRPARALDVAIRLVPGLDRHGHGDVAVALDVDLLVAPFPVVAMAAAAAARPVRLQARLDVDDLDRRIRLRLRQTGRVGAVGHDHRRGLAHLGGRRVYDDRSRGAVEAGGRRRRRGRNNARDAAAGDEHVGLRVLQVKTPLGGAPVFGRGAHDWQTKRKGR